MSEPRLGPPGNSILRIKISSCAGLNYGAKGDGKLRNKHWLSWPLVNAFYWTMPDLSLPRDLI